MAGQRRVGARALPGAQFPARSRFGCEFPPLARAAEAECHRGLAIAATRPEERFLEAYRAARSAGSSVLSTRRPRRGPSDVWARVAVEAPELAEWAKAFSGYSRLFAAVEDGLPRTVEAHFADDFLWAVGRFLGVVDERLGLLDSVA